MKVFRSELLETLHYYKVVVEKAQQIIYYYFPSRHVDIVDIKLLGASDEEKIRIEYYNEYSSNCIISVPLKWFELDDNEFIETINAYKEKEREEKEKREEERLLEKERREYERLKRKFEVESEDKK